MTPLDQAFERDMLNIYELAKPYGYDGTYFARMIHDHGGVGAAHRLLAARNAQQGLTILWRIGRLDLSMEALVIQEKYASLFTPDEIAIAHQRLEDLHYFK